MSDQSAPVIRVYLRTQDSQVSNKTLTSDPAVAWLAFARLVRSVEFKGKPFGAALTLNNRQVAYHGFDRQPGDLDYWLDRLDQMPAGLLQGVS